MSWGTEIWDQYEKVCSHTEHGIEFINRVRTFMEKRIAVEQSYAKELRKLVKAFRRKDEEESPYTAVQGFAKTVLETNDLAGQRELVAEYMEADVLNPLKSVARDVTTDRKKHMLTGAECLRHLKMTMDALERTKKAYEKASEEGEVALHTLEKADNDPNSTKAKIDKLTTILRQKEQTAEDCRNSYILQLEKTNAARQKHYHSTMPAVFKDLEDMNARRINQFKEIVTAFSDSQRKVLPVVNTCLDNITSAATDMDHNKDNQQLVTETKTGFPIPDDVEFVEYMGKQAKKSGGNKKGKIEPREDYSHLPPEQQRRKLQHKVDQLESLINKTNADKTAMEKMQTIYKEQPKLGDPEAVAQSLSVCERRLQELGNELEKYKEYLTNAILRINERPEKRQGGLTTVTAPRAKYSPQTAKRDPSPIKSPNNHGNNAQDDEFEDDDEDDDDGAQDDVEKQDPQEEWTHVEGDNEVEAKPIVQVVIMLYDFAGQNDEELTANANDRLMVMENPGDGWLRAKKGDKEGYVPESYVKFEED